MAIIRFDFPKFIALISLTAIISFALARMDVTLPRLTATVISPSEGQSIIFPHRDRVSGYTAELMEQRTIHPGHNHINITIREIGKRMRWDPVHGSPEKILIIAPTLRCLAWSEAIHEDSLTALSQIDIRSNSDGIEIQPIAGANDPQAELYLKKNYICTIRWIQITTLGLLLSAFSLIVWVWFKKNAPCLVIQRTCFCIISALALLYTVMPFIPSGYGAGWDGENYLNAINSLVHGMWPKDLSLYYYSRLGSFPACFAASIIDPKIHSLVQVQAFFNFFSVSLSILLCAIASIRLGAESHRTSLSLIAMSSCWAIAFTPGLYPIASDHMAFFVSAASIACWSVGKNFWLVPLASYALIVHPLLALMPGFMFVLPLKNKDGDANIGQQNSLWPRWRSLTAIIISAVTAGCVLQALFSIPDSKILDRAGVGLFPGLIEYRYFSAPLSALTISITMIFLIHVIFNIKINIFPAIFLRGFALILLATAIPLSLAWLLPANKTEGPPFLSNLLVQAQAAPLKQLAAHAYHNGPSFLLAISVCSWLAVRKKRFTALALSALIPMFFLSLGSETRQFSFVAPIIYCSLAISEIPARYIIVVLAGNFLCLLPCCGVFTALPQLHLEDDFLSPLWQTYFGHYGPWMGLPSYFYSLSILILCGIALIFSRTSKDFSEK